MVQMTEAALTIMRCVFGLALLTFAVSSWAGMSRLSAVKTASIDLEEFAHAADARDRLPSKVRRINDNYNHLLEQPTVFYAVALSIVFLGLADLFYSACAIAYVALRAVHSAVQCTFNSVSVRAPLYVLSWLILGAMAGRGLFQSFI